MTLVRRSDPQFKIDVDGTSYINDNALRTFVSRPINNISYAVLQLNDYKSKNYEAIFDTFDTLDINFRYGNDAWTKVFSGTNSTLEPHIDESGETLAVSAWGKGWCLQKTHCNRSYGVESQYPTINTSQKVWDDLVDNMIEKSYGGAVTGYSITKDRAGGTTSFTYLESPYKSNFDILNATMDICTAQAAGGAGHQWFMDTGTPPELRIRAIDSDANANWRKYWKVTQAASTLEVTKDMILYDFKNNVEEYANSIVLCTAFRKPAYDYWTEQATPTAIWGRSDVNLELLGNVAIEKVGTYCMSIRYDQAGGGNAKCYYPSTKDANWDLTAIGSEKSIPTLNFYARRSNTLSVFSVGLYTTNDANYYGCDVKGELASADIWYHLSLPIGPYYDYDESLTTFRWTGAGAAEDWSNIDYIQFTFESTNQTHYAYLDDLHFAGKIVREAKDAAEIAAHNEYQRVIRNDTAVDDTMEATDDSGTAAQLLYAELLRRASTPIVGVIQTPLIVDILPGQWVHIHASKKMDGTFRIDTDMRVLEIQHIFALPFPKTILSLTDDLTNSHAFSVPTVHGLLMEYAGALGHAEAKNLKGAGIDNRITKLSKSY